MLTISQTLPIKRMAIYGSTAMLVGFTSTLVMLRQFASKDSPSGVAVVETINKKSSSSDGATLDTKQTDSQSTTSVTALPGQDALVVRGAGLSSQAYSRVSTPLPTYTAPTTTDSVVATPTPDASAPVAANNGDGGSVVQQPIITQSSGLAPSPSETPTSLNVQDANTIDVNKATQP